MLHIHGVALGIARRRNWPVRRLQLGPSNDQGCRL